MKSPSSEEGWDAEAVVYWQAMRGEARDVTASFEWVDDQGIAVPASDGELVFGTAHLQEWQSNEVVRDVRRLLLPLPPLKKVRLRLTVAINGKEFGSAELGTIDSLPARPVSSKWEANPTLADFGGKMGMVGFEVSREGPKKGSPSGSPDRLLATVKPGDELQVNLWWRRLATSNEDYTVFVHLYDQKQLLAQNDQQPGDTFGTTSLWQRTEIYQGPHLLAIPPTIGPGVYRLEVGACLLETMTRLKLNGSNNSTALLGRIKVSQTPPAVSPPNRHDSTYGGAFNLH
ncbi:MAG: hypothetical protein Q7O66_22775 [Dehalococcoidia bacterium]|nr:hypothetical protein [Dehalococcoidia bacterium]